LYKYVKGALGAAPIDGAYSGGSGTPGGPGGSASYTNNGNGADLYNKTVVVGGSAGVGRTFRAGAGCRLSRQYDVSTDGGHGPHDTDRFAGSGRVLAG
jgi:hypothetical protein